METYEQLKNEEYRQKIKTLVDEFPDYCVGYTNHLRDKQPRTRLSYLQDLKVFYDFLGQTNPDAQKFRYVDYSIEFLSKLSRDDIDEYVSWLEGHYTYSSKGKPIHHVNSAAGVKRKLSSLRRFFNYMVNIAEYLDMNPVAKVTMPKVKEKEIRTVEADELDLLYQAYEDEYQKALKVIANTPEEQLRYQTKLRPAIVKRDLAIFKLFLGTGLRISELVGINTLDIRWDKARINIVRKGGDHDHIYVSDDAFDAVADYMENYRDQFSDFSEEDALFLSSKHCRLSPRQIEKTMKDYIELAVGKNTGITPHKLRATFGTNYYRYSKDIYATATVLGHKSVETTKKHYAKPSEKAKEDMRNINIYKIEE